MSASNKSFFGSIFGMGKKNAPAGARTVVNVKNIGDIPPVIEAKRLVGDGKIKAAVIVLYNAAKRDYIRFYGLNSPEGETNRQFIIRSFKSFGVEISEAGYTDNYAILEKVNDPPVINDYKINQFNTLRKLTFFYLDFYEKTRFSEDFVADAEVMMERLSDIYNYMDIVRLYFSGAGT